MAAHVGSTRQGHPLGYRPLGQANRAVRAGQGGRVSWDSPEPQDLRARQIGNVIVSGAVDRPWSQYFCCMVGGNPEIFVAIRSPPSARCAPSSRRQTSVPPIRHSSSRRLVDSGFTRVTSMPLQALSEIPIRPMAGIQPEDTVRFMRCGCATWASSNRARKSSSPKTPTGGS